MMKEKIRSLIGFFRRLFNFIYNILMATRLKEGMIPYTWWIGIEITDNHVINVLLRALNNLIHVNDDRELYVDLQIPDGVEPDYDFEVGVTTGRILEEDWWPQNGTILNWKTTSGDYVRLIYAADDKLYYDPWTWEWRLLATWEMIEDITADSNTKTFWIEDNQDLENAQAAYDWYMDGKSPILMHEWLFGMQMLTLGKDETNWTTHILAFAWGEEIIKGTSDSAVKAPIIQFQAEDGEVQNIIIQYWREFDVLETWFNYSVPYTPQYPWSPATKKYVDDWLALKQDKLIAWANISIAQDWKTISATIPQALVYKGSVNGLADLPSSWQTVWDTYFVEGEDWMYSWDGTQWSYVWGSGIDTTNLFNKTIDTSDDIVQWTTNLFVTSTEKNYWNSKQDALTAWANIQISNNIISATDTIYSAWTAMELVWNTFNNTKPFDPENAWVLSQVLKKTSTGYRWANETEWFDPENTGTTGQVLKKTSTGYAWANESWGWGWGWGWDYTAGNGISISGHVITNTKPFEPSTWGTAGQVLTKTANGYERASASTGTCNVKNFYFPSFNDATQAEIKAVVDWVEADINNGAIINTDAQDVYLYSDKDVNGGTTTYRFFSYRNRTSITSVTNGDFTTLKQIACAITYDGSTYTIGSTDFNPVANFLTVESSNYTTPYMPTADYQPATKAYVDAAVLWWGGWVLWITNNTTGTTYTITQEWAGTQAQYDALVNNNQIINGVIYNIIPSS